MPLVLDGSSSFITGLSINSANIVDGSIVNADINDLAASKLTGPLPAISGAALTGISAGITMVDTWRITTAFNHTNGDLTSNWSRQQTPATHFGGFGSAMTESSGVFTFPSNGHYLVTAIISGYGHGSRTYVGNIQKISTNSGSSFSNAISAWSSTYADSAHFSVVTRDIYDVTSYSTTRWKQYVEAQGLMQIFGSSTGNIGLTGVQFIRLGDT